MQDTTQVDSMDSDSIPSPGRSLDCEEKVILSDTEFVDEDVTTEMYLDIQQDYYLDHEPPPCPEDEDYIEDEWVDDNDMGYLLEHISEEEFLEIEEVFLICLRLLYYFNLINLY